jgi:acetyl esterase/lipase
MMLRRDLLRTCLLLASVLATTGCQRTYFAAINAGRQATAADQAYGVLPAQHLDVHRARGADPAPVAVFLYGGRWREGRREDYRFVAAALAARGILVVVPDYRRYPEVRFPGFVEDAALAVGWVREHARRHGGDPDRIVLVGHSAGAHIAALLATDARFLARHGLHPRDLAGVVGIAGPYDFLPLTDPGLRAVFGEEAGWDASQPVRFVDGDEPPFLLLHGDADRSVGPYNSARLAARLRAAAGEVEHRVYPGVGHVRILSAFRFPRLAPTLRDTADFIHAAR